MTKKLVLFCCILIAGSVFGQYEFNTDSLSIEVCTCIDGSIEKKEDKMNVLTNCVSEHLAKIDPSNFLNLEDSELTPYQQGRKFGDSITRVLINILIVECESWATYMYNTREEGLKRMVDYLQEEEIAKLKAELATSDSEEGNVELGVCYLRNGDMVGAKKQLDFCLSEYHNSTATLYFAGLYFELDNKLDVALDMYRKVYGNYPDDSVFMIIALVERKVRLQK